MSETKKPHLKLPPLPGEPTASITAAHFVPTEGLSVGVKSGRGRLGGSSSICYMGERAINDSRPIIMADGDVRNPMVSVAYPPESKYGAPRPASDQTADGMAWITSTMNLAAQKQSSVLIDLGGGDRVLQDWSSDVNFEDLAAALGLSVTGLFFCGPDPDDFEHVASVLNAGFFQPKRSILFLNEGMVPTGRSPQGAFNHIMADERMDAMLDRGVKTVLVPRLSCMAKLRASGLSYREAMDNAPMRNGERFGLAEAFFVKNWANKFEERLAAAGVTSWLP